MSGITEPGPQSKPPDRSPSGSALPVLAHVLGLLTGFLGPLVLYLAAKDDPAARRHASAALNWQLSLLIYLVGSAVAIAILAQAAAPLFVVLFVVWPALLLADFVVSIVGAVKAGNGEGFTYPAAIPFTNPV